jgi:putative hemin transport protein
MFVGPEIDLRCFVGSWKHCFAVGGARPSIQFFDGQGQAVHKVFARPATNTEAWDALIRDYTAGDQSRQLVVQAAAEIKPTADPETVNRDALIDAWGGLQDVHYFHGLLRTFNITRVHATRLVEGAYSRSVAPLTVVDCLEKAAANTIPMLIFVGNHANIQIHGGPIERTAWKDQWFNVLDPRFNLHLATDGIAESWITTKPVKGGTVTALECYDREGEVIVSLFGHRKEKQQEREDWRGLIQTLGRESDVDTAVQGAD